jgi:myosin protein heavy chain
VRIVDLETRSLSYASSSRSSNVVRRLEGRIEELTNQLNQTSKDSSRLNRTADKSAREAMVHLAESDRQRTRLEEELKSYESRVQTMRQTMDEMVSATLS